MSLSKDEVKKVAALARLELTEEEIDVLTPQLGNILGYIDQLKEVDTTNTEPTAQVTGLSDVFRADEYEDWDKSEVAAALAQSPAGLEGNQIKVKKVLEQD
ncbi:MAG: Asp-tRNA(Asn)/Glu-tRNA(Gln) amidotransferase subunit GatC [Patescibacteria group bacterium]|nr:Asp-tRNA(Asn)/Glu-tRNA(Gln) amidotransferase subunit GatC [Patescibacteria group bacterium]